MDTQNSMSGTVSEGFRPADAGIPRHDGTVLVLEAYIAIWILLMGFVLAGLRKLRRVEARISRLETAINNLDIMRAEPSSSANSTEAADSADSAEPADSANK